MRSSTVAAGAVVAVACVLAWGSALAQTEEAESKAVEAATAWLALVDTGKNVESWDAAASYFRAGVTREKWDERLARARRPLGYVRSRTLATKKYTTFLQDAPKGEYVVIMFKTEFENMPKAIETITPMLQRDGTWRVSGYNIKPAQR